MHTLHRILLTYVDLIICVDYSFFCVCESPVSTALISLNNVICSRPMLTLFKSEHKTLFTLFASARCSLHFSRVLMSVFMTIECLTNWLLYFAVRVFLFANWILQAHHHMKRRLEKQSFSPTPSPYSLLWVSLAHVGSCCPCFGQVEIEALACLYIPDPMQCKCSNIKLDWHGIKQLQARFNTGLCSWPSQNVSWIRKCPGKELMAHLKSAESMWKGYHTHR